MSFFSEEVKQELISRNEDISWAGFDQARNNRWEHLFNPAKCEHEQDKPFVDMSKDPVMDHYHVSEADRVKRRWVTEYCLDTMARECAKAERPMLLETTTNTSIAAFTKMALPLVRKYLPQQFIHEIVPSHPMSQATIRLFKADTTYGSSGGTYASGISIFGNPDPTYADDAGECGTIKELNFKITGSTVTAISKKLKTQWAIEAAQDLMGYHRLSIENEAVKMLGVEINHEINRYCINELVSESATTTNWNTTQPMATTNGWSNANPRQYAESIWDSIEDANMAIKDAQYVNANFLLCGNQYASRLRKLNGFRLLNGDDPNAGDVVTGPNLFGTLNGRYRLYEDPEFPTDKALIGHKPSSFDKTGAVYLPYVPAWQTPVVHNLTLCPGVGYLTRFAFEVINGNFYGMLINN